MAERVAPQVAIFSRIGQRPDADAIEHNPDSPLEQSPARSCTAGVPPVLFSNDRAAVNLPHCSAALSARSSPIIACEVARLHRAGSASSRMLEEKDGASTPKRGQGLGRASRFGRRPPARAAGQWCAGEAEKMRGAETSPLQPPLLPSLKKAESSFATGERDYAASFTPALAALRTTVQTSSLLIRVGMRAEKYMHQEHSGRSEEHTSELQSPCNLVCRLLLEKKKRNKIICRRIANNR